MLGDVNPGSSVIAAGDIVVLGSLRGNAYAGGNGRPGHYIAALEMAPQKIKIGDFKYIANEKANGPSEPMDFMVFMEVTEMQAMHPKYSRRRLMWKKNA